MLSLLVDIFTIYQVLRPLLMLDPWLIMVSPMMGIHVSLGVLSLWLQSELRMENLACSMV